MLIELAKLIHTFQAASGGEDAFFVKSDAGGVFAIADGVSG
jgi:protein phosphatase PTC7